MVKHLTTPKQQAYQFFYANAGTSYNPKTETKQHGRARGARMLAKAERDAKALGYFFEWEPDYDDYEGSLGDHAYWCEDEKNEVEHEHEVFCCVMRKYCDDGQHDTVSEVVQSLSGIIDPTREYRRVVEAELAAEQLG